MIHSNLNNIRFEKAAIKHEQLIFKWLEEPHIKEFWDNSQEHRDDILNFLHSRTQHYFYGTTRYWIGYIDDQPFAFILSDELLNSQTDLSDLHRQYLSTTGKTITLDFGIGDPGFIGKGLAAPTLQAFTEFYRSDIDNAADTFFIDPIIENPRALHVYEKAGFQKIGNFDMKTGAFKGKEISLMIKKFPEFLSKKK